MNKQDILDALAQKFALVLDTALANQSLSNLSEYKATVADTVGGVFSISEVRFYVLNEGEANEAAYWRDVEPKPEPAETFREKLQVWIDNAIVEGKVEGANIWVVDEENKTATVTAWIEDEHGVVRERHLFLDRDEEGQWRYRQAG